MKLIFVYNADSGALNAVMDGAHKLLSPQTYACDLCSLTYGTFKEKEEWVRFRESVTVPLEFLHRDEFLRSYRSKWLPKYDFPIVLAERSGTLEIVISKSAFEQLTSLDALIAHISAYVES